MDLRFFIDHDTGRPHFDRHGVLESEVREVLSGPDEVQAAQESAKAGTRKLHGGRVLRVIYREVPGPARFAVTAYFLRGRELDNFQRRRNKKR